MKLNVGDTVLYRIDTHPPKYRVARIKRVEDDGTRFALECQTDDEEVYWPARIFGYTHIAVEDCLPFNKDTWADIAWEQIVYTRAIKSAESFWQMWKLRNA